jgi:hypothetical protein
MAADLIGVPLDDIGMAGAGDDPVAALLFCQVPKVALNVVNGRVCVRGGQLVTVDLAEMVAKHRHLSAGLLG